MWKLVLLDQFHDVIPGTSIGLVYEDTKKHYDYCLKTVNEIISEFSNHLFKNFVNADLSQNLERYVHNIFDPEESTKSTKANYIAFNSENFDRLEYVTVPGPTKACSGFVQVPQNGYACFSPSDLTTVKSVQDPISCEEAKDSFMIDSKFYSVTLNKNGRITSYKDKQISQHRQKKMVDSEAAAINMLRLHDDIPDFWDAWDIFDWSRYTHTDVLADPDKTVVIDESEKAIGVRFEYAVSETSSLVQIVYFYSHTQRIDFSCSIDWNQNRKLLRVYFPVNVMSDHVTYDIQNGVLRRSANNNTTWEQAQYEVCGHKFASLSESGYGVAILNDCKYGYSCKNNLIGMSLLRSPKWPYEAADIGHHEFTYSFFLHTGADGLKDVQKAAFEINSPLKMFKVPEEVKIDQTPSQSLIEIDQSHIVLDAFKISENNKSDYILRVHESLGYTSDCKLTFNFLSIHNKALDTVEVANILENVKEDADQNLISFTSSEILINLRPFKILTLKLTFKDA